ncbi:cyclase family protein [Fusibacter sp. 3D3]|uniref:cyclase family protein n=1 Tax=Fusibacter sp. 3D3 TaxID=1048380 RepID=UPI000853D3DA|nr:cyclase family protein [Fusibacter sp. 3D3]GAU80037.1 metal-dependent hydrolase [Fusibacter sp. 3D3]
MKIVDLTFPIQNGMRKFDASWHIDTSVEPLGRIETVGRNTSKIIIGSHAGTHMDSPLHFIENGNSVDRLNLETLIGPVSIFDFSDLESNIKVTKQMLENLNLSDRVIFKFGWSDKWYNGDYYSNYPFFSAEAVEYMIQNKVKLVGLDTPSPDDSSIKLLSDQDSCIHKLLLRNEIVLIEYLDLSKVDEYDGWNIIALPMKLKDCDGSPSRVVLMKEE